MCTWRTAVSPLQKYAVDEFQSYARKMFSDSIDVSGEGGDCRVVIGTPSTNKMVKVAVDAGKLKLPTGKNSDQGYAIKTIDGAIYVAGATDMGVLYGVYTLLEEYGAYFQIDGEPAAANRFSRQEPRHRRKPDVQIPGILPWDNFLCGMSGWNFEQYTDYIDRAARMKFNMLQFHFYPALAFFTETWNGMPVEPKFLGSPVDTFKTKGSIGESVFGGGKFSARSPTSITSANPRSGRSLPGNDAARYRLCTCPRIQACVGFELMNPTGGDFSMVARTKDVEFINPVNPKNVEKSVERYRMLAKMYPKSDFYWLWQDEGGGFSIKISGHEPGVEEMRKKYSRWSSIGINGDIDYAYHFREVANRLTPAGTLQIGNGRMGRRVSIPRISTRIFQKACCSLR